MYPNPISLDRVRGMLMGAFLGDALGAPHEFRGGLGPYTGVLQYGTKMHTQFQGTKELAIGQCTDDTEMTLTLLRQMVKDGGYNKDNVTLAYLRWANSNVWMMGKNTRALLKGVTTLRGYQGRMKKMHETTGPSQSNGAMMRCSPLALLWDNNPVLEDVNITNPNIVCFDCNLCHITAIRLALQGMNGPEIFNKVKGIAQTDEVRTVLIQVEKKEFRNMVGEQTPTGFKKTKGWCLHGLYCAMMSIISFQNYHDAIDWVISSQPGSDTDTNACIAGALLGAMFGFETMQRDSITGQNIEILLHADIANGPTPRPAEYTPHDFYELTEAAHRLTLKK